MKSNVNPHIKVVLSLVFAAALDIGTLTAQLVNDGATNTLSNVTNTFTGDVTVGTNGSFTLLVLSDNTLLTNSANGVVGRNATANSNEVRLVSATARWQMGGSLIVGHNGAFNHLLVSNGATVLSASSCTIGNDAFGGSPNSNSVTISGAGSLWNSGQDLIVGELGFANRLEVNNGGWVVNSNAFVGRSFFSPSNMVVVTGAGSVWSNRADLNVGGTGTGNLLIVSNGGWVVNNNASIGASSLGNLALVTGTNSVWSNRTDLFVGNGARGNRLVVSDGGRVVNNNGVLGFNAFSSNNLALVTDSGSLWSNLTGFILGRQGPGNLVVVSNGGILKTSSSIQLGQQATSTNNTMIVTGAGSRWDSVFDGVVLGLGGGGNRLLITNGGVVLSGQNAVGSLSSSINNEVLVTDTGSRWIHIGISLGQSGSGNRLVITNGGGVFGTAYINVGENPSSTNNRVVVDGGTLIVTNGAGLGSLDIRRGTNVLNAGLIEADILRMTNGTLSKLEFNSGTLAIKSSRVSAGSVFIGNGTSPATLHLAGNGTHDFTGTSSLTIANNATLTGSGTLLVSLFTQVGSTLSPGASIGKISGNTTAFLGGTAVMEISKNGSVLTNDQLQATGTITYGSGGSLIVSNLGPTALTDGDSFPIFNAATYAGAFFSTTLPPLDPGLGWTNRLLVDGTLQVRALAPPTVSTLAADALSASMERLNGRANPQAADTTAWFEWGATTNYGNVTPPQSLGSGMANTNFSAVLAGLTINDTYHFRAVVSNSVGVVFGSDRNFRTLDAYLKASNTEADDNFGFSVAASGDTVVIGVIDEDSNATGVNGNQSNNGAVSAGAAYVFVRSGDSWTQQAYLKASNAEANDNFGYSVAVSGDTVAVGAIGESSNATGVNGSQSNNSSVTSGAAYVFVRSGTNWTQQAYVKAGNTGAGDQFGTSVALSGDTLVVGARLEDSNATSINGNGGDNTADNSGAAYVFARNGTNWTQQAYLKASNTGASDQFGNTVSVSGDTVVVGAFGEDSNAIGVNGNGSDNSASGSGAAYVYVRSGTNWNQQAYLKASNTGAGDSFGLSVSVSGNTVVVGADDEASQTTGVNGDQANNSAVFSGAAYVFERSGTNWSQQAYLKASNTEADDHFGDSVSVSGNTIVVGAPFEDSNASGINGNQTNNGATLSGAAYVFVRSGTNWIQGDYLKASNGESGDTFGDAVAVSGGTIVIAATGESSNATGVNGDQNNNNALISGAAYVYSTLIPPTLAIFPSGVSQVTLSWTPATPGFSLQETLSMSPVNWSNSPSGPTNPITIPASGQTRFFRLFKP